MNATAPPFTTSSSWDLPLVGWSLCRIEAGSLVTLVNGREEETKSAVGASLPSAYRRRASRMTKLQLEAALLACPGDARPKVGSVFASRYGELETTMSLLRAIGEDEPLSPTAFSSSVHNTAAGIFSILHGNREPSTALAGARGTLPYGFLETVRLLARNPSAPALLVIADEPLPPMCERFADEKGEAYAAAFFFDAKGDARGLRFTLEVSASDPRESEGERREGAEALLRAPLALPFVQWLGEGEGSFREQDGPRLFRWERPDG